MDYVKQAYAISNKQKAEAIEIYKGAVKKLVSKKFVKEMGNALIDLSAFFTTDWIESHNPSAKGKELATVYAEGYVAFNYANLAIGSNGGFVSIAETEVKTANRKDDKVLGRMASQLEDMVMPFTTPEAMEDYVLELTEYLSAAVKKSKLKQAPQQP